jgi:hypothetical protein
MSRAAREPSDPEDKWQTLRDGATQAFNVAGLILLGLGTCTAVGIALRQCGAAGYFLAYFAAFYLPTLWLQVEHSSDQDALKEADWMRGGVAVLTLGAMHGAILLSYEIGLIGETEITEKEQFFGLLLPLFLAVECLISYGRARRRRAE